MIALIRGEAIKLRSTRTAIGFAIAGAAITLLVVLATLLGGDPTSVDDKRDALGVGGPVAFVLIIFGIVGATGEYRHRTLAPAILIAPDRSRLLLARALAYGVTAVAVGLLMIVVSFVLGLALLGGTDGPNPAASDYLELAGGAVLTCGLGAMMGVGFGALVANQVGAVVGALVYFFVLENLAELVWHNLPKFTIGQSSATVGGSSMGTAFGFGGSLLVLVGWTVILLGAGLWRERRREVT